MTAETTFRAKAPVLMDRLLKEGFGFDVTDVAAIAGNGGHESRGFTAFQEEKPTVKGSRGGWSWYQWTGPRRRQFEAFCAKNNMGLKSDEAAMQFLILELKGPEKAAVSKTKAAVGLQKKVIAFELGYERAADFAKHYPSRLRWANIALEAYSGARTPAEPTEPAVVETPPATPPAPPKPAYKPSIQLIMGLLAAAGAVLAAIFGLK